MGSAFRVPRQIPNATKIPLLGWEDRINLVRTEGVSFSALRAGGARLDEANGWYIRRDADVLLEPLDPFLPHLARKSIVPNVVDLIPETSWCSSLANLLSSGAWTALRNSAVSRAGGCEDCGTREKLECHELWSYDEKTGVQKLESLRSLCSDCHETHHLGYANVRDRYTIAFRRLVTLNRIEKREEAEFEQEIVEKYRRRSEIDWELDLSLLKGRSLTLKKSFEQVAPKTVMGETRMGETEVSIIGLAIGHNGKAVVLA